MEQRLNVITLAVDDLERALVFYRDGLGLAIVKSITQAHDGTLTLTPRAAGGLRVTVQLPAAPPHTGR